MKRIIPCLDIKNGRIVKGVNFVGLKDIGNPIDAAKAYDEQGADEIVLLDIIGTDESKEIIRNIIPEVAKQIKIPFAVGGGIRDLEDFEVVFGLGASKASINSSAFKTPGLIKDAADKFGSDRIVVAIDAKKTGNDRWNLVISGGKEDTGKDAVEWAKEVEKLGAGEILLTSMDCDGVKNGYDIELTKAVAEAVNIPVIASGGAGKLEDFYDALTAGKADAVLAASLFHFGEVSVPELREYLKERGVD